jgi:hypothetical protein
MNVFSLIGKVVELGDNSQLLFEALKTSLFDVFILGKTDCMVTSLSLIYVFR